MPVTLLTSTNSEKIINTVLSSLSKANGQLDYKAYLLRQYVEHFQLRHANLFLDLIDFKTSEVSK